MYRQFDHTKLINDELCKECGGQCCLRCGCAYFPEDFKFDLTFENLKSEIDKGFIAIDMLTHLHSPYNKLDNPIYYLRVRNINDYTPIGKQTIGACKRLENDHCYFDFENRPSGGKFYVPFRRGCYTLYTTKEFIDYWIPYQELLICLIKYYEN